MSCLKKTTWVFLDGDPFTTNLRHLTLRTLLPCLTHTSCWQGAGGQRREAEAATRRPLLHLFNFGAFLVPSPARPPFKDREHEAKEERLKLLREGQISIISTLVPSPERPPIKYREQEAKEERLKLLREGHISISELPKEDNLGGKGSFDDGDPFTTNLYLGNVAPDVDEMILMREFGRCVLTWRGISTR